MVQIPQAEVVPAQATQDDQMVTLTIMQPFLNNPMEMIELDVVTVLESTTVVDVLRMVCGEEFFERYAGCTLYIVYPDDITVEIRVAENGGSITMKRISCAEEEVTG